MTDIVDMITSELIKSDLMKKVKENINIDSLAKKVAKEVETKVLQCIKDMDSDDFEYIQDEIFGTLDTTPITKFVNSVIKENF